MYNKLGNKVLPNTYVQKLVAEPDTIKYPLYLDKNCLIPGKFYRLPLNTLSI